MERRPLFLLALCIWGVASLRLQPQHTLAARRRPVPRAVLFASVSTERLLEECEKDERELSLITSGVRELEGAETPKKLKRALLADWRLAFASDQEAADMLLTGQASMVLTIEGVVASFQAGDQMRAIEVLRPFGPFGNRRNSLMGRWGLEKTELRWRYTYLFDDNNSRELDVPEAAKGTHTAQVTHASDELLVLRRSESSFLLLEKVKLQDELEKLRAADAPPEEEKEASTTPVPLPKLELPKVKLPEGLPKVDLPDLPKLPKLPF